MLQIDISRMRDAAIHLARGGAPATGYSDMSVACKDYRRRNKNKGMSD